MLLGNSIKDSEYAKTLLEHNIVNGSVLKVLRNSNNYMNMLIMRDNNLVEKAEVAFKEIFELFSTDDKMYLENIATFLNAYESIYYY